MIDINYNNPYNSTRQATYAKNGMVATTQPLAAQAGLEILKKGGNAIDAAIATAACLTVVEPTSNGIGGDAFALVWTKGQLHGLNATGPAPKNISIQKVKEAGYKEIPQTGWIPVTVPGLPSAWAELSKHFGKLSLMQALEPAIHYAEYGFPISPIIHQNWEKAHEFFKKELKGWEFEKWFNMFAPGGHIPHEGEIWASHDHSRTLSSIAETNAESFYRGELADKMVAFSEQSGGYLTTDDLGEYQPEWVEPIKVDYHGYSVWEIPPNSQGIITLQALNILKEYELNAGETLEAYHKQIEAIKLAFLDGEKFIADSRYMTVNISDLLSDAYAKERRSQIRKNALLPAAGNPPEGGTTYLATADNQGNMVSFIQSNYKDFGSGLVVPDTGINLQNRGFSFSFNSNHPNSLMPGKHPYSTIIPGFLTKNKKAIGPFGVMGGFMQPQGHVQTVVNMIDFGFNPQAALDAPRWRWVKNKELKIERNFSHDIAVGLTKKQHDVQISLDSNEFGRGQIIWRDPNSGVLVGGTESRSDGTIAAW